MWLAHCVNSMNQTGAGRMSIGSAHKRIRETESFIEKVSPGSHLDDIIKKKILKHFNNKQKFF